MTRRPSVFDEGIVLTAAMRVAAGQIPHRDFYALYGPAQFYILAGLFRLFGNSLLVERLFDIFSKSLVISVVYFAVATYCRRSLAVFGGIGALLWLVSLNQWPGSPMMPVSFLNLIGSILILPVFSRRPSSGRLFAVGAISGLAGLFRYDTGIALFAVHTCAIGFAIYSRYQGVSDRRRAFVILFAVYLAGFAIVTLPPALYYFSVAPVGPLVHDIILYPARYYHRGRNLPFPAVNIHVLEYLGIYLPIVLAPLALFTAVYAPISSSNGGSSRGARDNQALRGLLITFGLLTVAMYLKGYVRVSLFQMSLAIIPSLLLSAALVQHRHNLPKLIRFLVLCLAGLSISAAASSAYHQIKFLFLTHMSLPEYFLLPARAATAPPSTEWCNFPGPLTRGICFLPEDDRIRTIEFIDTHTSQDQTLYSGLARHDKIFAADNILYFATQRLPATRWSELDPDLESRYDVQMQMVHELEAGAPPYVVLDSEFERIHEPNDSSTSSGVTLLDEYLRRRYLLIEAFGAMTIGKLRTP